MVRLNGAACWPPGGAGGAGGAGGVTGLALAVGNVGMLGGVGTCSDVATGGGGAAGAEALGAFNEDAVKPSTRIAGITGGAIFSCGFATNERFGSNTSGHVAALSPTDSRPIA